MKTHKARWVAAALATFLAVSSAVANDDDQAPVVDSNRLLARMAAREAELPQVRDQAAQNNVSVVAYGKETPLFGSDNQPWLEPPQCTPSVGCDFTNTGCRKSGFVGQFEAIMIEPYYQGGGDPSKLVGTFYRGEQLRYNYQVAPRVTLGYVGANGLGGRFRFFDYHQTGSVAQTSLGANATTTGMLGLRTYDAELTQQINFRYWNLQTFGGLRYAQVNQQGHFSGVGADFIDASLSYYGLGLTGGLQGDRALTSDGRLSMHSWGRGSILFGNQRSNISNSFSSILAFPSGNNVTNDVPATIWELGAGPQYKRRIGRGADLVFRGTVEAQYWQGVGNFNQVNSFALGFGISNAIGSQGFALLGIGGSIGIQR